MTAPVSAFVPARTTGNRPPSARLWLALIACAILVHAVISLAIPESNWTTQAGVGLCLLVAAAFCVRQGWASAGGMRWRWIILASAFVCWIGSYAATIWLTFVVPDGSPRIQLDSFFSTLRVVPYLLLLARSGDGDEGRAFRWIDTGQALLFSGLALALLFPFLIHSDQASTVTSQAAETYHDVQNIALALLSLVGLIEQPTPERRRFAIALSALLVSYAVEATLTNHLIIDRLSPPPGTVSNITADIPPLILILLATAGSGTRAAAARSARPRHILQLLLPAAFCGASLAAAFAIAQRDPWIGMIGAALALLLKAMRSALLQSQLGALQRFIADVVERLPDAVCVIGTDDTVRLGNEAASHLFGIEPKGQPFETLLARLQRNSPEGEAIDMADGRTLVVAEAPLASGERIVRFTDVTRVRQIERDREEALEFLSHDMRSPNAAILALLERRGAELSVTASATELVDRIRRHARHGLRMADDFVRLARVRTAAIDDLPVDVGDAVAEAADMVWPIAQEKRIILAGDDGRAIEAWTRGDRALIIRVVHNLLENGIKFAPEGSVLHYGVAMNGDRLAITVSNEGPDLPAERQRDLFGRFGPGEFGVGFNGVGLGLAFVHAAIRRHGGTVRYGREAPRHVFTIDLPLLADE